MQGRPYAADYRDEPIELISRVKSSFARTAITANNGLRIISASRRLELRRPGKCRASLRRLANVDFRCRALRLWQSRLFHSTMRMSGLPPKADSAGRSAKGQTRT